MIFKRLIGSVLVLSLLAMASGVVAKETKEVKEEKKEANEKGSTFGLWDVVKGTVSLGLVAGAGYGYYWANDCNIKKTIKPLTGCVFLGAFLTAGYLCAGKWILNSFVNDAEATINRFGEKVKNQVESVSTAIDKVVLGKLKAFQKGFESQFDKISILLNKWNPFGKKDEVFKKDLEKKRNLQNKKEKKKEHDAQYTKEFEKENGKGVESTANVMNTTVNGKINVYKFSNQEKENEEKERKNQQKDSGNLGVPINNFLISQDGQKNPMETSFCVVSVEEINNTGDPKKTGNDNKKKD